MSDLDVKVKLFLHCAKCLQEKPPDVSPADWASLEVGVTDHGILIRCVRHDLIIDHIDKNSFPDLENCQCKKCVEETKEIVGNNKIH